MEARTCPSLPLPYRSAGITPDNQFGHPSDHPDSFVARRWSIEPGGARAERVMIVACAIAPIRAWLHATGFHRMLASPGDDPVILETWF